MDLTASSFRTDVELQMISMYSGGWACGWRPHTIKTYIAEKAQEKEQAKTHQGL